MSHNQTHKLNDGMIALGRLNDEVALLLQFGTEATRLQDHIIQHGHQPSNCRWARRLARHFHASNWRIIDTLHQLGGKPKAHLAATDFVDFDELARFVQIGWGESVTVEGKQEPQLRTHEVVVDATDCDGMDRFGDAQVDFEGRNLGVRFTRGLPWSVNGRIYVGYEIELLD